MITPRWTLEAFIRITITVGSLRAKCTLARVIETEAPKRANGAVARFVRAVQMVFAACRAVARLREVLASETELTLCRSLV